MKDLATFVMPSTEIVFVSRVRTATQRVTRCRMAAMANAATTAFVAMVVMSM